MNVVLEHPIAHVFQEWGHVVPIVAHILHNPYVGQHPVSRFEVYNHIITD